MKLDILDKFVDIYVGQGQLFIVDRLSDTVVKTNEDAVKATLKSINDNIPHDMVSWLIGKKPAVVRLAICSNCEITDWRRIPQAIRDSKPVKPSAIIGGDNA